MYPTWFGRALDGCRSHVVTAGVVAALAVAEEAWTRESVALPQAAPKAPDGSVSTAPSPVYEHTLGTRPMAEPSVLPEVSPPAEPPRVLIELPSAAGGAAPVRHKREAFRLQGAVFNLRLLGTGGAPEARPRLSLFVGNSPANLAGLKLHF